MRQPVRTRSVRRPKGKRPVAPGARRDRLALLLALVTILCLDAIFFLSKDTQFLQFLMPGPLTTQIRPARSRTAAAPFCHIWVPGCSPSLSS